MTKIMTFFLLFFMYRAEACSCNGCPSSGRLGNNPIPLMTQSLLPSPGLLSPQKPNSHHDAVTTPDNISNEGNEYKDAVRAIALHVDDMPGSTLPKNELMGPDKRGTFLANPLHQDPHELQASLEKPWQLTLPGRDGILLTQGYYRLLGPTKIVSTLVSLEEVKPLLGQYYPNMVKYLLTRELFNAAQAIPLSEKCRIFSSSLSDKDRADSLCVLVKKRYAYELHLANCGVLNLGTSPISLAICGAALDKKKDDASKEVIVLELVTLYANQYLMGIITKAEARKKMRALNEQCPEASRAKYQKKREAADAFINKKEDMIAIVNNSNNQGELDRVNFARLNKRAEENLMQLRSMTTDPEKILLYDYQILRRQIEIAFSLERFNKEIQTYKIKIAEAEEIVRKLTAKPLATVLDLYKAYANIIGNDVQQLLETSFVVFMHPLRSKDVKEVKEAKAIESSFGYCKALRDLAVERKMSIEGFDLIEAFLESLRGDDARLIAIYAAAEAEKAREKAEKRQMIVERVRKELEARKAITLTTAINPPSPPRIATSVPPLRTGTTVSESDQRIREDAADTRRQAAEREKALQDKAAKREARKSTGTHEEDKETEGKGIAPVPSAEPTVIADLIYLKTTASRVDAEIESGTWKFTKEAFEIYLSNLGFVVESGGRHTKASLPDSLIIKGKDGKIVSIVVTQFPNLPGSLTLPISSWQDDFVPYYLRDQIVIARQKFAGLIEKINS